MIIKTGFKCKSPDFGVLGLKTLLTSWNTVSGFRWGTGPAWPGPSPSLSPPISKQVWFQPISKQVWFQPIRRQAWFQPIRRQAWFQLAITTTRTILHKL